MSNIFCYDFFGKGNFLILKKETQLANYFISGRFWKLNVTFINE